MVVRREILDQNKDAIHELTGSLVSSGKLVQSDPAKAADIGARFLSQEKDIIHTVLTQPADRVTYGELLPQHEDLNTMQEYLTGKISAMSGKIDLEQFIDLSYAKAAGAQ